MAYDKELDKEIFSESADFDKTKITVSVFSYNDGTPKVQLSRETADMASGEMKWAKLGRMTKEETEAILPLISRALEKM
ncbi:MAG: hypothetical protein JW716_05580 [Candidatus Aenigmarchaeota archaeon]|nr:hypothetical protein [Candidatus Aenigmarchaeota archaeon]